MRQHGHPLLKDLVSTTLLILAAGPTTFAQMPCERLTSLKLSNGNTAIDLFARSLDEEALFPAV